MTHSIYNQGCGEEIITEEDGSVLRIRLSQHDRREPILVLFCFLGSAGLILFIALLDFLMEVFIGKKNTHSFVFFLIFSLFPLLGCLFFLLGLWWHEWLGAEFIVSDRGIEKQMPSGKTFWGAWDDLIEVQLSHNRLIFRDGTVISLVYGVSKGLGSGTLNKIADGLFYS